MPDLLIYWFVACLCVALTLGCGMLIIAMWLLLKDLWTTE